MKWKALIIFLIFFISISSSYALFNDDIYLIQNINQTTYNNTYINGTSDGTGGWTNTSTTTSTGLNVNVTGNITADNLFSFIDWNYILNPPWITDGNTGWDNIYNFITNSVETLTNFYNKTDIDEMFANISTSTSISNTTIIEVVECNFENTTIIDYEYIS